MWKIHWYDADRAQKWKLSSIMWKQAKKRKESYTSTFFELTYKHPYKYDMLLCARDVDPNAIVEMRLLYADDLSVVNASSTASASKPAITGNQAVFESTPSKKKPASAPSGGVEALELAHPKAETSGAACATSSPIDIQSFDDPYFTQASHIGPWQFTVCSFKLERPVCLGIYVSIPVENQGQLQTRSVCCMVSPTFTIKSKKPPVSKTHRDDVIIDEEEEEEREMPVKKKSSNGKRPRHNPPAAVAEDDSEKKKQEEYLDMITKMDPTQFANMASAFNEKMNEQITLDHLKRFMQDIGNPEAPASSSNPFSLPPELDFTWTPLPNPVAVNNGTNSAFSNEDTIIASLETFSSEARLNFLSRLAVSLSGTEKNFLMSKLKEDANSYMMTPISANPGGIFAPIASGAAVVVGQNPNISQGQAPQLSPPPTPFGDSWL